MRTESQENIFLLGGKDLEMHVIRETLNEMNLPYIDAHLTWNCAYLSQYVNVLAEKGNNPSVHIYGVELIEDVCPPSNYERIDHHNNYSDRPASLIQVLHLLNHPVTRYHELVAANDVGYIPGMKKIHATDNEIQEIRKQDRKCQGVSENDELIADESIHNNLRRIGDLTIVYTKTSFFSTITDRLYPFKNLLVHTDQEATYYGSKVSELKQLFKSEIEQHKMYYGGHDGYFGIAKNAYDATTFDNYINQLINLHQ